jgi:hypothetical protein
MKRSLKVFVPLFALGLAATSLVRAADNPATVQVPLPAAPDSSDSSAPAAKGKGGRPMRGGPMMDNVKAMKEKLNLTDGQAKQIGGIIKNHGDEFRAARGDRAKMQEIQKQQRSEIRAVLNADQQKTFDAMPSPGDRARGAGNGNGDGKGKGKGKGKKNDV